MFAEDCLNCGEEAVVLYGGLCRECRVREINGGYLFPQYLTGRYPGVEAATDEVCAHLQAMLANYAKFEELHGSPYA